MAMLYGTILLANELRQLDQRVEQRVEQRNRYNLEVLHSNTKLNYA